MIQYSDIIETNIRVIKTIYDMIVILNSIKFAIESNGYGSVEQIQIEQIEYSSPYKKAYESHSCVLVPHAFIYSLQIILTREEKERKEPERSKKEVKKIRRKGLERKKRERAEGYFFISVLFFYIEKKG